MRSYYGRVFGRVNARVWVCWGGCVGVGVLAEFGGGIWGRLRCVFALFLHLLFSALSFSFSLSCALDRIIRDLLGEGFDVFHRHRPCAAKLEEDKKEGRRALCRSRLEVRVLDEFRGRSRDLGGVGVGRGWVQGVGF